MGDEDRKEVGVAVNSGYAVDKIIDPKRTNNDKWAGNIRLSCFHTDLLLRTYACNSPPTSAAAAASPRTYVRTYVHLFGVEPTHSQYVLGGGTSLVSRRTGLGSPHRST